MRKLSEREREVLVLLCCGKGNKEIAEDLGLGTETVRSHLKSIYLKLGVHSRGEAIVLTLSTAQASATS